MENLHNYWNLPANEREPIRIEADCMTDEEYDAFINALFPPYESLNEAMRASGADSDE